MKLDTSALSAVARRLAAGLVLWFAAHAQAAYDVTIAAAGTGSGGAWAGNTWTASAPGATVPASDIAFRLNSGGPSTNVIISTGSGGAENGRITVSGGMAWTSLATLTLRAAGDIDVNATLSAPLWGALTLEYGQGAPAAGNQAVYRINVPVELKSHYSNPSGIALFNIKRGSDGAVDDRVVPACSGRPGGCPFLSSGSPMTNLDIRYRSVQVDGTADSDIWVWLDLPSLIGPTYYPFVMQCQQGEGVLYYPRNQEQRNYFNSSGTITDLAGLERTTTTTRLCKDWSNGPILSLLSSQDFPWGYYIKFRANAGETGSGYQIFSVLVTPNSEVNSSYTVVDYVINVHPDTVPDAFTFNDLADVALATPTESNTITVAGITNPVPISVAGGEYEINASGTWTSAGGTVANGATVKVRHTSSATNLTATDTTLTIGGVADTFTSTTLAAGPPPDSTPDAFSFADQAHVALSVTVTSAPVPITGMDASAGWVATGGQACVSSGNDCACDVAVWADGGSIDNGRYLCARHDSAAGLAATVATTVTVGGVADTFSSTTIAAPNAGYSGPMAAGTGTGSAAIAGGGPGCGFTRAQFVPLSLIPEAPPAGVSFPHGLFDFALGGCTPAGTVTLTVTFPQALPPGTQYWKYGPTWDDIAPHWYQIPVTVSGDRAIFTITDGGLGDDDLTADGTIVDQGGPGNPATSVPTLSFWGLLLLALGVAGLAVRRRACHGSTGGAA